MLNEGKKGKYMTRETWNTFLDVMKEDRNTIVLDLTKEEENEENENLVNKFDKLFYNMDNLDIQSSYLRDILRLVPNKNLRELIKEMREEK